MRSDVVVTTSGPVREVVEDHSVIFRGIPYAAPPFGDRLWQLSEPPKAWSEVRDCSSFGLSRGHPLGATGIANIYGSACAVHILEKSAA